MPSLPVANLAFDPSRGQTLIILFLALLIHGVIISTFTSAILTVDSASQYRKQRIDRVSQYLAFQGVDATLRGRVIEFYKYVFRHPHSLERNELKELPAQMAAQLLVQMHKPLITNCQLFSLLDNATILRVLRRLYPSTLPPTHVVIREGHLPTALYFIIRGLVRIRMRDAPSTTLSDHDFFGEHGSATTDGVLKISGSGGRPSGAAAGVDDGLSAVCLTYCNLMLLDHADFERVIAHSNLAAMNKKFLKMSGADAQLKRNKRLGSVVDSVVENKQRELRESSLVESIRGSGVSPESSTPTALAPFAAAAPGFRRAATPTESRITEGSERSDSHRSGGASSDKLGAQPSSAAEGLERVAMVSAGAMPSTEVEVELGALSQADGSCLRRITDAEGSPSASPAAAADEAGAP